MEQFFLNTSLVWIGLPILALPILIHLINLMRHRKVAWAAMEFVVASYKKSSTWILLKQLLLLLLRILAIAFVIMILAQLVLQDQWKYLLGGVTTHHVVLLDDSYSMSDKVADKTLLDLAKEAIQRIGEQAAAARSRQKFTLIAFSNSEKPEIYEALVDRNFGVKLSSALGRVQGTQLDVGPLPVLDSIFTSLEEPKDEKRVVYLVSDFRTREWDNPRDINDRLTRLEADGADLKLIRCIDAAHNNLALTALRPRPGTIAAGVPVFMEVTVKNFGTAPAKNVSVLLAEDGQARSPLLIDEIGPGLTQTRRFQVSFVTAGEHQITASLEQDVIAADNVRHCVVNLPVGVPVLLIDGDPDGSDARFLSYALSPGEPIRTGIDAQIEMPKFLNTAKLDNYQAVYLTNIERLDQAAVENLEAYARRGGGIGFFVGEQLSVRFFNDELYQEGKGLFPAPLAAEFDLIVDRVDKAPDLDPAIDHPIFRIFEYQRNDFLEKVNVWKYYALLKDWQPDPESTTKVIARLRNGAPLAIEHRFEGRGRVVAFLTTAAPVWNNWARNPSYVVAIQELQGHLATSNWSDESRDVGTTLRIERLDPARYQPAYRFKVPGDELSGKATIRDNALDIELAETRQSGVYELHLATNDAKPEVRLFAFNVNPEEGNLKLLDPSDLKKRLTVKKLEISQAGQVQGAAQDAQSSSVSEFLLYALIFLMVGEQILAYSASYHPASLKGIR
jgi:hypothetical protein